MRRIKQLFSDIQKGISGTGSLIGELERQRPAPARPLEPGDLIITDKDDDKVKQQASPIAYDLWYLKHVQNLLPEEVTDEDALTTLSFLDNYLGGMRPLRIIKNVVDLARNVNDYRVGMGFSPRWKNMGSYFCHLLAYETWHKGLGEQCYSEGPDVRYGFDRNGVVAYVAFPVGQLGVMEVISVFGGREIETLDLTDELKPNATTTSEYFFPPVDEYTGKNKCVGTHIIASGYLVPEDARSRVEHISTTPIPEEYYADIRPQTWMRYWIHRDDTFPAPGEFIGILTKPLALPPHIWWFQETSPLLYAGNWFETTQLTGGKVLSVILEDERTDGGVGNQYTVEVQGIEITVDGSDFLLYEVDDYVGIVKTDILVETSTDAAFLWNARKDIAADEAAGITAYLPTTYQIIPVAFYQNTGDV